jgi:UDP-N-acetylglucosamine 2-epimerase (non-hydrolysing)
LDFFEIKADYDLNIMKSNQDLFDVTSNVLLGLRNIFEKDRPDFVFVHGDTSTSFAASLAAYYFRIDVAHIEAGLRTGNIYSPFPEEMNRKLTADIAKLHFAPTDLAKNNLLNESVDDRFVFVTGNTVIDALFLATEKVKVSNRYMNEKNYIDQFEDKKIVLITGHRRENFGQGFLNICESIKFLAEKNEDCVFIYPVHLNPNVQKPVNDILANIENIKLIEPLDYEPFVYAMNKSYLILTDSGGIQEEAPSLGKPVLVMRDTTERPEAIDAGTVILVGTDKKKIIDNVQILLENKIAYDKMKASKNPYGDGKASERIDKVMMDYFNL